MLRPSLTAALAGLALAVTGCGGDDPPPRDLRSERLVVLDWRRADPRALCDTEAAARAVPGRTAVRTSDTPAGKQCWIALVTDESVATGTDVTDVTTVDGSREELRFSDAARARIVALGSDAHVGVVYGDRLLDVVFPQAGRVRVPAG